MTSLTLVDTDPAELAVDAVVIGVYAHEGGDAKLLLAMLNSGSNAREINGYRAAT